MTSNKSESAVDIESDRIAFDTHADDHDREWSTTPFNARQGCERPNNAFNRYVDDVGMGVPIGEGCAGSTGIPTHLPFLGANI